MIEVRIKQNDQNKRLDHFVRKYLNNAPLSFIYKLFRKKDIKVNKKPAKPDYITKLDDLIYIYVKDNDLHQSKDIQTSSRQDFSVIYEDDNILIVNKPINLLVHDGEDKNEDTLTRQVLNYLITNNKYNPEQENTFIPSLAHRIDRNTSGLVIFGKTSLALQNLFEMFKNHDCLEKKYVALVAGKVTSGGIVDAPLKKDENKKMVFVDRNGQNAKTIYTPIQHYNDVSLVELVILTGRTHQIRVHMQYIKHPLVGDKKYGNKASDELLKKYKMKNYLLHAKQITFKNIEGPLKYLENKTFVAPLHKWQLSLLENLKKESF